MKDNRPSPSTSASSNTLATISSLSCGCSSPFVSSLVASRRSSLPMYMSSSKSYMRNAYQALISRGAASLNTDIMSRKSSNVRFPEPSCENTWHMRRLNGFSLSSGSFSISSTGTAMVCGWFSVMRLGTNAGFTSLKRLNTLSISFLVKNVQS
ncbi:unnamed protein product [Chrysodeixis includens]|uniref:Uncharacterized protein n=1 Tax=Chrysodeixis includens TaxID=689277 RepID=A0A9N8KRI6_CHRIL|nr:unnamed protein product [Chrysodeixis includens]